MNEIIIGMAVLLIAAGILCALLRLILGPDSIDRVIAVDLISIASISIIAILAHLGQRFIYIDVAIVYGLLSFLGVLAFARYLENGL